MQEFLCCDNRENTVMKCPKCKNLFGYCFSCSSIFPNLKEPQKSIKLAENEQIVCKGCNSPLSSGASVKYLASAEDLINAGFAEMATQKLLLRQAEDSSASPSHSLKALPVASPVSEEPDLDLSASQRCRRCGTEMPVGAAKCTQCGHIPGTTGSLKQTRKLKKKGLAKYFPASLNEIDIPLKYAIPIIVLIPALVYLGYMKTSGQLCLGCVQAGGNYNAEVKTKKATFDAVIMLTQSSAHLSGQVQLTDSNAPKPEPGKPSATVKKYVAILQSGQVANDTITFQTYSKGTHIEFLGQLGADNVIKGQMKLSIPELEISESVPITAKKF